MQLHSSHLRRVLTDGAFRTAFQPIYSLTTGRVAGVEALSRFTLYPHVAPGAWFRVAHEVGLGVELELETLRCALHTAHGLPAGVALWANLSPVALLEPQVLELLGERGVPDLVVEVTEQTATDGYGPLLEQVARLRAEGVTVAVDDVGRSRTSYRHLRRLRPDHLKADLSVTASLDGPSPRRLVAGSLVRAAHRRGASLVAEGVETPAQLRAWQRLGADLVQGFFLAAPSPLHQALGAPAIAEARARRLTAV